MKNFLKEKLKNKFLTGILGAIFIILGISGYLSLELFGKDTNSYVELIKGKGFINNNKLNEKNKLKLKVGDIIVTKGKESIAVIEWGDGSITRLGGNSKIVINQLDIKEDLSQINLIFTLKEGKTHSNVVSYLGEKSYFKQNFEDTEATVRGTTFDVDLSNNYIYVQNHEVLVKKGNKKTIVKEGSAFDFSIFSFIEIKKFLNELKDEAWSSMNENLDKIHLEELKKELGEKFSRKNINKIIENAVGDNAEDLIKLDKEIRNFSEEKKEEIYNSLLTQYQKLNFITAKDGELFKTKNKIKKLLISSAKEEEKENLVKYSIYDLQDALNSKNLDAIKDSLNLLGENIDTVKNLDFDLNTDFFKDLKVIPDGMKQFFEENGNLLKNVIGDKIPELDKLDFDFLKNKADLIKEKIGELGNLLINKKNEQ